MLPTSNTELGYNHLCRGFSTDLLYLNEANYDILPYPTTRKRYPEGNTTDSGLGFSLFTRRY